MNSPCNYLIISTKKLFVLGNFLIISCQFDILGMNVSPLLFRCLLLYQAWRSEIRSILCNCFHKLLLQNLCFKPHWFWFKYIAPLDSVNSRHISRFSSNLNFRYVCSYRNFSWWWNRTRYQDQASSKFRSLWIKRYKIQR